MTIGGCVERQSAVEKVGFEGACRSITGMLGGHIYKFM